MRVLVCGGRDFADIGLMNATLQRIDDQYGITTLIHGAAKGADTMAARWAVSRCEVIRCPANWKRDGKMAGPIRNADMLRTHRPELVVAFPGGRGTADMVRRARAAGVRVIEVERVAEGGERG